MIGMHETGALCDIREFTMTHSDAIAAGITYWQNSNIPLSAPVFIYTFGGIEGGMIINERADFMTLCEFAKCADDIAQQIWDDLHNEWNADSWENPHLSDLPGFARREFPY